MENFIGVGWSGSENDVLPAGDGADGYKSVTFHNVGDDFPVYDDVRKYVVATGKAAGAGDQIGTAVYNRGFYAAMLASEAVLKAQDIHGVADITPAMMRDGMEALEITEARMAELGMPNFGPAFSVSCENHGGPGTVGVAQWNAGTKNWSLIEGFTGTDMSVIQPLIDADSAAFASENNISPSCN
jgi:branched-chain amino acid transport system substrate-binding protein